MARDVEEEGFGTPELSTFLHYVQGDQSIFHTKKILDFFLLLFVRKVGVKEAHFVVTKPTYIHNIVG